MGRELNDVNEGDMPRSGAWGSSRQKHLPVGMPSSPLSRLPVFFIQAPSPSEPHWSWGRGAGCTFQLIASSR